MFTVNLTPRKTILKTVVLLGTLTGFAWAYLNSNFLNFKTSPTTCDRSTLTVTGSSMYPVLISGQTVQIEWRGPSRCGILAPGRVVVYRLSTERILQVKRVIAFAGDRLTLDPSGELLRNGIPPVNSRRIPYRLTRAQWAVIATNLDQESRVAPDRVVLFGESPSMALDSRIFGAISEEDILGVVVDGV
jgi:signal peptidase I